MFHHEMQGLPGVGLDEETFGARVLLGLADAEGNLIGYFDDERYYPNHRGSVDEIGAEYGEDTLDPSFIVVGMADDDGNVIGWFGSKMLKSVAKAVTAPVKAAVQITTAPVRAAIDISKGKNVFQTIKRTALQPIQTTAQGVKAGMNITSPLTKAVGKVASKTKLGKALWSPVAAGLQMAKAPMSIAEAASRGDVKGVFRAATKPIATGAKGVQATLSLSSPVTKAIGKVAGKTPLGTALWKPLEAGMQLAKAPAEALTGIAQGKNVAKTLKTELFTKPLETHMQGTKALLKVSEPVLKVAAPVIKSPITKAIAGGLALVYPPVGIPLSAGLVAADAYLRMAEKAKSAATMGLAVADKVLAAANGKLPAMKTAPAAVSQALQLAAKATVSATYAAAKTGNPGAVRGVQMLVAARKVQQAVPRAQALVPKVADAAPGAILHGNLVTKDRKVIRGPWVRQPTAGAGVTEAPVVLANGVIIKAPWKAG